MCLLDFASEWTDDTIVCIATSHLKEDNPLRRANRLSPVCGCEYGFQAAALHGAILSGHPAPRGFLAGLRLTIATDRLDDPAHGLLIVTATREAADAGGLIYGFALHAEHGALLLHGRATVMLPKALP